MKKITALFLILLLVMALMLSFVGCTDEAMSPDGGIGPGIGDGEGGEQYPEYIPDTPLIPLV